MPTDTHVDFLGYLRRRMIRLWVIAGSVLVLGIILEVATSDSILEFVGAVLLIVGVLAVPSALLGERTLAKGRVLFEGGSRPLQMWTYPIRGRGGWTVAVLATFDEIGSENRTPMAQVKTGWFTAGIAEKPTGVAQVYGVLESGMGLSSRSGPAVITSFGPTAQVGFLRPRPVLVVSSR